MTMRNFLMCQSENKSSKITEAWMESAYIPLARADGIVTICEMKYSKDDYTLSEKEYRNIVRRMETFQKETGHKGGIQVSLVTTYGLHENMYSEISPIPITMEELFIYE